MMFRTRIVLLLLLLCCHGVASAQRSGRSRRSFDPTVVLISLPEVQAELNVNDEQLKLLEAMKSDMAAQRRAGNSQQRQQRRQVTSRLWNVLLEEDQALRFAELQLQFELWHASDRDEFAQKLELSDDQRQQIRQRRRDSDDALPTDWADQLDDVLTSDQLEQWLALLGKTFEFSDETQQFRKFYYNRRRR